MDDDDNERYYTLTFVGKCKPSDVDEIAAQLAADNKFAIVSTEPSTDQLLDGFNPKYLVSATC